MLDASSSIGGDPNFQLCLQFIKVVYGSFSISATGYRIGMVLFGASASVSFDFGKYSSASEIGAAIGSMKMIGGSCAAGQGLSTCQTQLFAQSRQNAAKVLLVMIAGKSTDDVSGVAASLKSSGVKIFCLGMGSSFDKNQLLAMATAESYVQMAADYSQLALLSSHFVSIVGQVAAGKLMEWEFLRFSNSSRNFVTSIFSIMKLLLPVHLSIEKTHVSIRWSCFFFSYFALATT